MALDDDGNRSQAPLCQPQTACPICGSPFKLCQIKLLLPSGLFMLECLQVARDSDGFLSTDVLIHQEKLFTRSMEELCGQAATNLTAKFQSRGCAALVWATGRYLNRKMASAEPMVRDRGLNINVPNNAMCLYSINECSYVQAVCGAGAFDVADVGGPEAHAPPGPARPAITREARRSELSVKGSVEAEKAVAKAEMEEVSSVRSEIVGPAMFCFECSSPGACANSCVREVAVYYIRSDTLALFYVECSSPGACTRGCFRDIALIIGSFQQTMEHLLLRLLPGPQSWLHSHDCGSQVTHMNEVLNRCASAPATISLLRVLSRQAEIDQLRAKVTELEIHIASQANFNPALLQQQIEELQINVSISERQVQNLNAKLEVSGVWVAGREGREDCQIFAFHPPRSTVAKITPQSGASNFCLEGNRGNWYWLGLKMKFCYRPARLYRSAEGGELPHKQVVRGAQRLHQHGLQAGSAHAPPQPAKDAALGAGAGGWGALLHASLSATALSKHQDAWSNALAAVGRIDAYS
eukprot:1150573-Pelagomonas_calceolata.AAC.10